MPSFVLEPEVAGGLGVNTVMDTTVHPPRVSRLHYEFDGWLGDPIVESFPCFVVTEATAGLIRAADLTGVEWSPVDVSFSEQFFELHPGQAIPRFRWMRVTGAPGSDDFGLGADHRLVVSERALALLRAGGMRQALVEEYGAGSSSRSEQG